MKKAIKIGAFVFAGALLFASCKKSYTCECTSTSSLSTYEKTGKGKDAESACNDAADKVLGIPTEVCVEKK